MNEDERAIRELVQAWFAASQRGDTEAVLRLMTDDVIFMVPGQEPFGKAAFAQASENMENVQVKGAYDIREIHVAGNFAYLRNYIEISITPPGGETVRRSGYTLTILRKGPGGKWLLARDANLVS